jgi:hypothetical protein
MCHELGSQCACSWMCAWGKTSGSGKAMPAHSPGYVRQCDSPLWCASALLTVFKLACKAATELLFLIPPQHRNRCNARNKN